MGVNSQAELAEAERLFQQVRRETFLAAGVTMPAPDTVHFAWDTAVEGGVLIEPNVVFGPGVTHRLGRPHPRLHPSGGRHGGLGRRGRPLRPPAPRRRRWARAPRSAISSR